MANRIIRVAKMGIAFLALAVVVGAQSVPSSTHAMELFKQRKWTEASVAFQQIEDAAPGQTDALLFAGKCLVNLGKFGEAGAALQEYQWKHPQSEDAAYLLGYVRFREGKAADSLQMFTAAAQLKPPTADDLKIVALDYVLLNDFDDA